MDNEKLITDEALQHARNLLARMEAGDEQAVGALLDELAVVRETWLFKEIGKLTRNLHEALRSPQLDERLASLAHQDMPDARHRLSHVITMTDEAAHRTLSAVEDCMPLSDELRQTSAKLGDAWQRFLKRDMQAQEFRELSREIDTFLGQTQTVAERLSRHLSDVLMAQDFQDLTGQIIRRVIEMVEELENSLVGLIKASGGRYAQAPAAASAGGASTLEGPAVPGAVSASAVAGQDEVDDLLSSLGF